MEPLISVIIPVYKVEKYLRRCVDSVLAQTMTEIEVLCVDDGSTDSSLDILHEYAAKDSRVTVYTQDHQFAGAARNLGIKHAAGKYLLFLDADDIFDPQLVAKSYTRAEESPPFRLWITRTRLSASAYVSQIAGQPSGEPSSTRMTSKLP